MDEKIVKDSHGLVKELVNDCISRQAAIDALEKIDCSDGVGISSLKCDAVDDAVTAIKVLPSAQPERMRGKWIDAVIPNDNGGLLVQVCDQCNTFFPLAYTGGGHHFCPNCGADMRGEADE